MSDALPRYFNEFLAPGTDRFSFVYESLKARGLGPSVVRMAGSRHIVAAPAGRPPLSAKKPSVLVAHYDRANGTPGANDNSAAVFQLMAAAERLRDDDGWLIVFTDREEAASTEGARGQGSYALAEGFKSIGLGDAEFYIFDACGRGDTVAVSTTMDLLASEAERTKRNGRELRLRALEAGRAAAGGRIILAPTPFSDDAGFLAAGVAAQTITLLPATEAASLIRALRNKPEHARALIDKAARDRMEPRALKAILPETWAALHSSDDDAASLTPAAFPLMERFVCALARR